MSSSEVARNQLTFEERAKYFEKDVKEFFNSYENESGGEDCIEVCLIQAGRRAIAMAEKEIKRQKEEIESLKAECQAADNYEALLRLEAYKEILGRLRFEIVNKPSEIKIAEATVDLLNGMTRRHHEILDILDNLLKEVVGDNNA